ncbi:hypothetical protein D1AOALGA4SA_12501 [Olavius algarvensis Delta 1 endosymbiont]|nr:hypothetical protein D1AOALGA4SA_12501 [Olavius algarvensis Delta 1 endosymbiont]
MNFEVRHSIDLNFSKIVRGKRFHTSLFDISCSIFCGSLLNFHVVSLEIDGHYPICAGGDKPHKR